jgi:hypothetical protein
MGEGALQKAAFALYRPLDHLSGRPSSETFRRYGKGTGVTEDKREWSCRVVYLKMDGEAEEIA